MNGLQKDYHKITVSDMAPHVHVFLPNENKVDKIFKWMKDWIKLSLECNKIHPYDLLPAKADLACHIGVSQGTIQNVFRLLENIGLVESKQRIGTYIKDFKSKSNIEKLTSKRELAVEILKKYILDNEYVQDEMLVSTRKLAQILGISNTTLRTAVVTLVQDGILYKKGKDFFVNNLEFKVEKIETKTLVEKLAENIRKYIQESLKAGDKLPSNSELAKMFDVSVKTVHDAIKCLAKEGLIYSRRGQYGTIVLDEIENKKDSYLYLKYEQKLRQFIIEKYEVGQKLPSIKDLAKYYKISEKTIKKALDNLAYDGYVTYARGRYGGTFVTDIPQGSGEAYKWLAINVDYMNN